MVVAVKWSMSDSGTFIAKLSIVIVSFLFQFKLRLRCLRVERIVSILLSTNQQHTLMFHS